jgi:hypothetical protein
VGLDATLLREARETRDRVIELLHEAERARVDHHYAVRRLHASGASMRQIAEALGLSHQRIHQIVDEGGRETTSKVTRIGLLNRLARRGGVEDCGSEADPAQGPFARFFPDAREAVALAQEEARALNHNYIGTEHLLLGLLRAEQGLAARLLGSIGADLGQTRKALEERLVGRRESEPPPGALPFTPRSKNAFELALKEAKSQRSVHVRSEHLLLGLARVREGLAAKVLAELGADYESIRRRVDRAAMACSLCGRSGVDVDQLIAGPGVYICEHCVQDASGLARPGERARRRGELSVVPRTREDAKCEFCGKGIAEVERLVAGSSAAICSECLALCGGELAGEHGHSIA